MQSTGVRIGNDMKQIKNKVRTDVHLFFENDDIPKIHEYVRKNFPDETAEAIRKADETVRQRFLFDCRWDLESCFVPVDFSGSIDWLYKPADDPEWTYSLNRMRYWICLGQAYVFTGDERYAQTFALQLSDWVQRVKKTDALYAPAWRTIEAGFRLEYWIKAYQYFRQSPSLTAEIRNIFFTSVSEHAEYIISSYNSFNVISNWGVLANHGLFMAGILLDNTAYCSTALVRLGEELETQVYRDGMQWEQSPMYHNEVLHDFLDVLILADRNGVLVNSDIRGRVHDMCRAAQYFQKPDHHEPMSGDSDDLDISYNTARGAYVFKDSCMKFCSIPEFDYDTVWDTGFAAAEEYAAMPAVSPDTASRFLAESGNVYMRSGWEKDSTYIHFHCGTLGAGHGHSDQLHTDVYSGGEDILCDAGRFTYVSKPERYEFKDAQAHNTVTVDDVNYCRWKDSWGASSFCRPVNQKFIFAEKYAYCEGGHTGYMSLEAGGVFVNRRILFIQPDIILFCDEFFGTGVHTYRQYFHFSDTGNVVPYGKELFRFTGKKESAVLLFPEADKQLFSSKLIQTRISRHYGKSSSNGTVCSSIQGSGCMNMSAVLFTGTAETDRFSAEKVPVRSMVTGAQKESVFPDEKIEAWNIEKGRRRYTVVIAHTEFAAPTDMFCTDGCTGFANVMVFDRIDGTRTVILR